MTLKCIKCGDNSMWVSVKKPWRSWCYLHLPKKAGKVKRIDPEEGKKQKSLLEDNV